MQTKKPVANSPLSELRCSELNGLSINRLTYKKKKETKIRCLFSKVCTQCSIHKDNRGKRKQNFIYQLVMKIK